MNKRKHRKKKRDKSPNKTSLNNDLKLPGKITANASISSGAAKQFNFDLNFWFGVIGVVGTIAGILALWFYFSDKKTDALTGKLSSPVTANQMSVAIGSSKVIVNTTNGVFLRDHTEPLVWLKLQDEKLLVSANFRDEKGDLIAELRENEWKLNKELIFDRNYNESALEVRGQNGEVVLQVVNCGTVISFAGSLRCSNGRLVTLTSNESGKGVWDFYSPPRYKIKTIFEYPSDTHFGKCPGLKDLTKRSIANLSSGYVISESIDVGGGREGIIIMEN